MGITGTMAKGAADMILTDDNFAAIVHAGGQGRGIYANIKKIHSILAIAASVGCRRLVATALNFHQMPLGTHQLCS